VTTGSAAAAAAAHMHVCCLCVNLRRRPHHLGAFNVLACSRSKSNITSNK
jgi:hypothetical protein